jgi:hypothetical protein
VTDVIHNHVLQREFRSKEEQMYGAFLLQDYFFMLMTRPRLRKISMIWVDDIQLKLNRPTHFLEQRRDVLKDLGAKLQKGFQPSRIELFLAKPFDDVPSGGLLLDGIYQCVVK